LKLKRLWNSDE